MQRTFALAAKAGAAPLSELVSGFGGVGKEYWKTAKSLSNKIEEVRTSSLRGPESEYHKQYEPQASAYNAAFHRALGEREIIIGKIKTEIAGKEKNEQAEIIFSLLNFAVPLPKTMNLQYQSLFRGILRLALAEGLTDGIQEICAEKTDEKSKIIGTAIALISGKIPSTSPESAVSESLVEKIGNIVHGIGACK